MADQPPRSAVPSDQTWDLTDLFPDRQAWHRASDAVQEAIPTLTAHRGRVGDSATSLLAALEADEAVQLALRRVVAYAMLRSAVDQTDVERQSDVARAQRLGSEVERQRTFLADEILALPADTVTAYLHQEPRLEAFARPLERLQRDRPYRLEPQTEAVLAAFGEAFEAPHTLYQRATGADARFDPATDAQGRSHAVSMGRWMFTFGPSPLRGRPFFLGSLDASFMVVP